MKIIIESSSVPIYNRIATAFAKSLIDFGHTVYFIDVSNFTESEFSITINDIEIDYYISTNELNLCHKYSDIDGMFLFEKIKNKFIFIHHDNLFSAFNSVKYIISKIKALANISHRSYHFCIEDSNLELLNSLGIKNTFKIYHATEFRADPKIHKTDLGITFVGHLMSGLNLYPSETVTGGRHLNVMAWNRFRQSSYAIQPKIKEIIEDPYFLSSLGKEFTENKLALQQFMMAGLNKFSSALRGQLISTIKDYNVNIFGGDLSYGRINDPLLIIRQSNILYKPATIDYQSASVIYQSSKINLNISALQFDTAINNRFFDIVSSGGFVLTDKRKDLEKVSSEISELVFETPEEMIYKISFYMNPRNDSKRKEIIEYTQSLVLKEYSYSILCDFILKNVSKYEINS